MANAFLSQFIICINNHQLQILLLFHVISFCLGFARLTPKKEVILTKANQTPKSDLPIKAGNKGAQMLLKAYSVKDQKAEVYNVPFFQKTHGEAERNFRTLTNDQKSTVSQFPEDFDLYYVGDYDDATGTFKALDTPLHIIKAVQLIDRKPAELN